MLMSLCNLDASEKEKTRNGKICKWCSSFSVFWTCLLIPRREEQKRPKHILGVLRSTSGFYLYLLIVSKDGEKYIKKKEKNAFLCI
jgi:hypothetical protein